MSTDNLRARRKARGWSQAFVPDICPLLAGPLVIKLATTRPITFLPTVKVGEVY